ncbi:aldehyde dehydrogenase family protein (plasmid) [Cupriavidus necator]|uniref:Aldehyde dehydrogenase family protein n=1 Tax=Cupriavidus necator TaxID=106590 RepID=A0A1U9V2Q3_CUPNE|nr:aldehyde dehydrogenase family protein [Cupriavidus necator]AQV99234.1 aldehyde dehydrogenase family protein [Cupriavidus necator]
MKHYGKFYIDGAWVDPSAPSRIELIDPAKEEAFATVAMGGQEDVEKAVAAARRAFHSFSTTSTAYRMAMLDRVIAAYVARADDLTNIIAQEMGAPRSSGVQVSGPIDHLKVARDVLSSYSFESRIGDSIVRREPIGVCGLISPWNWPIQTPITKIAYALAAGCTMVFKPSEASPLSGLILAEIMDAAQVPKGVFNVVVGDGPSVGEAISRHPDVDMVSFTGSTRAGIMVGRSAADTVKRVSLELGGKSANVVLPDADLEAAARWNIQRCFFNVGQSCHAPSRMLVHESQLKDVIPYLVDAAGKFRIGDPRDPETTMGPLVNRAQFERVQRFIQSGIDEGARLVCGGVGRPDGMAKGFFTKPTVFVGVKPEMIIATEEVFGPVLSVLTYSSEDEAIDIANQGPYGLGGYVFSSSSEHGFDVARRLRAGRISFNGAPASNAAPMGGYRQSGNGRSMGVFGLEEYLEIKAVFGFREKASTLPVLAR